MKLKLTRSACVIDLETTGTNINEDRIVQISIIKIFPDDTPRVTKTKYINPEIPIPESATAVHKITDSLVKDEPVFRQIAKSLYEFIKGCDIIAYNGNYFDIPLLYNEFFRAGIEWNVEDISFIDSMQIFKIKEARTLEAAVKFYCLEEHVNAHDAKYDAEAALSVLEGQLSVYDDIADMDIEALALFSNYGNKRADVHNRFYLNDKDEYVINFGKHKGKLALENIGFVEWMLHPDRNFSPDTIRICNVIIDKFKKTKV